jgi:hypothetical protein
MFSAYFDESGTPDRTHTVLTVAGCVSSTRKWVRFKTEWTQTLRNAGLPDGTIFHMNKFARGIPPYQEWYGQPRLKAELFSALVKCTKKHVNKAFSCSVVLRDWERLNQIYCVSESLGFPYPFCGRTCVAQALKWARNKGVAQPEVEFFFERGAKHRGQLEKFLLANDGIGPLFPSKTEMVQFQAADLLAWKSRKVLADVFGIRGNDDLDAYLSVKRSLEEINSIPHAYGIHDYASMEKLCLRAQVPRRAHHI